LVQNPVLIPCLIALVTLGIPCHSEAIASGLHTVQSRESYEAAIRNNSTSPSYVLVSIINSEKGQMKPVCTTANFLLGAIHREYGLGYEAADSSKAAEIALKNQAHVFHFHQQAALDNIRVEYSENELSAARVLLASLSTGELRTTFSSLRPEIRLPIVGYAMDAIACALVERGLSPKLSDRSGQVHIDR
jgi:hypothetical protein